MQRGVLACTRASPKLLMQGLGEVLNDAKSKTFVKNKLIDETSSALELFSHFLSYIKSKFLLM